MFEKQSIIFKNKKEKKHCAILASIYVFLYSQFCMLIIWTFSIFQNVDIDQIIFTTITPISGTSYAVLLKLYIEVLIIPIIITLVNFILILKEKQFIINLKNGKHFKIAPCLCKHPIIYAAIFLFVVFGYCQHKLHYLQYAYYSRLPPSDLYEENYIDPSKVEFEFPEKKRNLIILYLESMEITATDKEHGGLLKYNLIPELVQLAEENLSFSNTENLGGATQVAGATHSVASLTCLNLGVPLILQIPSITSLASIAGAYFNSPKFKIDNFMTGGYGLGDLLYDNDYNLVFSMSSDKDFGCLGQFLKTHKNFDIRTAKEYKEQNRLAKNYSVWWGFEDEKLYQFAREDISSLAKEDKPFAYIFFTADTHSPGGYKDSNCKNNYFENIHNVYAEASKKVYTFIEWAKTQPFYDNTTILISGDHLYMGGDLYPLTVKKDDRHPYNVFINSVKTTDKNKNRKFATFDLFPTVVESLGITFNAKGLGLGVSLFSGEKTLLEQKGLNKLNAEIERKSAFYESNLMKKPDKKE